MKLAQWFLPVILVVSALEGCAAIWTHPQQNGTAYEPAVAHVCLDIPAAQKPAAREAVAMWDKALKQWRRLEVDDGEKVPSSNGCDYWVHESTTSLEESPSALAWSWVGGKEVVLRKGFYEKDTKGILLHELGHALGAQHLPGTLMDAEWAPNRYMCPDMDTVAQVAAYNRVSIELLSWCYP